MKKLILKYKTASRSLPQTYSYQLHARVADITKTKSFTRLNGLIDGRREFGHRNKKIGYGFKQLLKDIFLVKNDRKQSKKKRFKNLILLIYRKK